MTILGKKLKEIPLETREEYLQKKYRELQLVNYCDRLTDRYSSLPKLMNRALDLLLHMFRCRDAAFLLVGTPKNDKEGFFLVSRREKISSGLRESIWKILSRFLAEPSSCLTVNAGEAGDGEKRVKSYMVIPMAINSELEGAFLVANRPTPFTEEDRYYLEVVSSQLDNAVVHCRSMRDHAKVKATLKKRLKQLDILYDMSLSLSYSYDFETLSRKVMENVMELLRVDRCSILKYDPKSDELSPILVIGERQKIRLVKLTMGKGIAGLALLSQKPILATSGSDDDRFVPYDFKGIKPKKIYSLACLPLMAKENPIGVMNFAMLSPKKVITQDDLDTMNVAAHMISLAFQRQQFYQMSIQDELTGLYSFRYFKERLSEETSRAVRYKMIFSLILFDLDKFKSINDTCGHPFGNVVLKNTADIIQHMIRTGVDMPARFGGEEMALILPHTDLKGAEVVAERIRQKVEALRLEYDGKPVKITISGGVSSFPTHGDTAETLLEMADAALYRAKENGRNRIELAVTS